MSKLLLISTLFVAVPLAGQSPEAIDSARHALNRLAYGPTPGQIERVARHGVMRWVEEQLQPERLVPSTPLRDAEARFSLLDVSADDLAERYFERIQQVQEFQRRGMSEDQIRAKFREEGQNGQAYQLQAQQLAIARAVLSATQLEEVLVDFWVNHFNVDMNKGFGRFLVPSYVEETIRPRVWGSFEDLLIATAQSPAMLFYLDNHQSVAPDSKPPELARLEQRMSRARMNRVRSRVTDQQRQRLERAMSRLPKGLNENYARELLELHTLGVDGGYTQRDVQEVARILTGWGIKPPRRAGIGFEFHSWAHDRGQKVVMNERFPSGRGMDEGVELLRFLARHPSTQRHISHKLCERFVSDAVPDGCVDRAVRAWRQTAGDLRAVVAAVVTSPDFWAPVNRGAKIKTPLEFVVSAARAMGATPDTTPVLAMMVRRLGQPLFQQSPPTGYPEQREDWVNSGALLNRMNIAMTLVSGGRAGVTIEADPAFPSGETHDALVADIDRSIFGGAMAESTRQVIREEIADIRNPERARRMAMGLALGGPDFQRQ